MLFKRERKKNKTKRAIVKNRELIGFNDLLSYLSLVDENVVLHKDGGLSAHFSYQGADKESLDEAGLIRHAHSWKKALAKLGNGWMLETNIISQPLPTNNQAIQFPEIASQLIHDEGCLQSADSQHFYSKQFLSLSYKPESKHEVRYKKFLFDEQKSPDALNLKLYCEPFLKQVSSVINTLSCNFRITPLSDDELTSFLYQCMSGKTHGLKHAGAGVFLDCALAKDDFIGGVQPKIGKHFIKVLALDDLPAASYPSILDSLNLFPTTYRWSTRFIALDKQTQKHYLKRYERNWSSKAIGLWGIIRESMGFPVRLDSDAQSMADELKDAQTLTSADHCDFGFYNTSLVLMDEDKARLEKVAEAFTKHIENLNFAVRDEFVNAPEAYLGSLPCHGDYNLRKMLVDTQYVSHALPTTSCYQGEIKAPCPFYGDSAPALLLTTTTGARPFHLNLHVSDVGHTLVIGPTGSGKTTLLGALITAHRQYSGSRVILFDKDRSNWPIVKALGGTYYDWDKIDAAFSPLASLDKDKPQTLDAAFNWLSDAIKLQGVKVTPERAQLLRDAISRLSHEASAVRNLNHLSLQDETLRSAIKELNTGLRAKLLNGKDALFAGCDITAIETKELISQKENDLNLCVLTALFSEMDTVFKDKRPTLLILEEGWFYLRHQIFREKLNDWFLTLRKANVAIVLTTQSPRHITESEINASIQDSCPTRIFLPNSEAVQFKASYGAFGLSESQVNTIAAATPKQDYYYHSRLGQRLFQLNLGVLASLFIMLSDKDELAAFEEIDTKEAGWVSTWLKRKGMAELAEFVSTHYEQAQVAA